MRMVVLPSCGLERRRAEPELQPGSVRDDRLQVLLTDHSVAVKVKEPSELEKPHWWSLSLG